MVSQMYISRVLIGLTIPGLIILRRVLRYRRSRRRAQLIPHNKERVLIIGGTSGIGRAIAHEYAARGARVCITGRRQAELQAVENECLALYPRSHAPNLLKAEKHLVCIPADFANAQDMVHVRSELESAWGGVDTVIVSAGVSALRPLLDIAGVERNQPKSQASVEDIERTVTIAGAAQRGNFVGPLVSAVTFIPLLQSSSPLPSILLVSSLAAVVPAPTRSLYAATKASSLVLYQALAIEHPSITFSFIIPSTVEGDFRASAVDGGEAREADPNKHGLKRVTVARQCLQAVDAGEKLVFMPVWFGRLGHFLYWLWPAVIEKVASRKYQFSA